MATARGKAVQARGWIVLCVLGLLMATFAARVATYFATHGVHSVARAAQALPSLIADIGAHPAAIDFSQRSVIATFAATIAAVVLLAVLALQKGEKLENEDTGAEHGDDRLATMAEMRSLADRKHYSNNLIFSENCQMAMQPCDAHTKEVLDGRNLNCITLGISGLGKTYNIVWPDLMQSVGTALEYAPYGIRNVPEHFVQTRFWKTCKWLARSLFKRKLTDSEVSANAVRGGDDGKGKGARGQGSKKPRKQETKEASKNRAERVVYANLFSRFSPVVRETLAGARKRVGEVGENYADAVGKPMSRKEAKAKAAAAVSGGYDVFCTDPKGDNVRDVGCIYERAGYAVKVVNTIDFKDGLKFNPFAYIKRHAVDARPVEETAVKVTVRGPAEAGAGEPKAEAVIGMADTGVLAPGQSQAAARRPDADFGTVVKPALWEASAAYSMTTDTWGSGEVPRATMTKAEIDERSNAIADELAKAGEADDKARIDELNRERDMLQEQMNIWWMHEEMGLYSEAHAQVVNKELDVDGGAEKAASVALGCEKVAEALDTFSYKRSSGTIRLLFKNRSANPMDVEFGIELDDALVVDSVRECTCGEVVWSTNADGDPIATGEVIWKLPACAPAPPKGERKPYEELVLHVHVKTEFVPDGVDLTKIVDCLVANLKGTDAQSNGSEDPFWEDTKRLCFMSLTAMLFERYAPEYQNLPEVMRLLDMALSDTGNPADPSPLQCLMEMWEYGRVYGGVPEGQEGQSSRYAAPQSSWRKADNISHSRNNSLALHCYHAFMNGAPETVQSVIISCQACLVNLVTEDAKEFLSADELGLDTLGDPGQKQVVFCVTKDTNSPFDFVTALIVYLAIDLCQDKAYKVYGGKLPRHVRFVLDEAANIGKIPILIRALAVVRSRNMSIHLLLQSKAQLALVYGKEEADVIFDNCTTLLYLGAQTEDTREEMSKKVGTETVQSRRFQRSFSGNQLLTNSASESITSNERRVVSASKMGRLEKGYLMLFVFNAPGAIFDRKFRTRRHPLYAYINPGDERSSWLEPLCRVDERFDYRKYLAAKRDAAAEVREVVALDG